MSFKNIKGHAPQIDALARSVSKERIAHAYLFSGPDGIGKKLTAIEFAKLINCENKNLRNAECTCRSCIKVSKDIHPDVHIFEYSEIKTIKVDQIREDIERIVYLSPYESMFKIFILDNAERMNFNAQNAFLKTLEEPPINSVIILVTSLMDLIIPTVRSRCRIVNFNRLSEKEIRDYFSGLEEYNSEELKLISKISEGSIGRGIEIDRDFLKSREEYIQKLLNADASEPATIFDFAEQVQKLSKGSDISRLKQFFDIISVWISDSVSVKAGIDKNHLINTDMSELLEQFVKDRELKDLLNKFNVIEESWNNIVVYNANKQLTVENLLLELSS